MKNPFKLLLFCLCFFCAGMQAQDMIVKKDGSILKGKIMEVSEESVKYKKADNPDGPMYTISKENILSINYANGEVEKLDKQPAKKAKSEDDEFADEGKEKRNPILDDEQMKRTIEGIAKDVGEQLLRSCANGKVDNSSTEIYWDAVFKDAITNELSIAILTTCKPK